MLSESSLYHNFLSLFFVGKLKETGWRTFSAIGGYVVLEFACQLQRRQHMIRSIITFEAAHVLNGVWGKVHKPLLYSL